MKGKRSFWMLALAVLVLSMASVPMRAFAEEQEGGDTGVTITAVTVGSITRQEDQRDTASGYADPETGTWVEEEWQQLNCGPSNVHVELSNGESFDGQEWEIRDALRSYFNAPDVHWETDETPQSLWSAGQTYTARLYVEGVVAEYSVTVEAAPELETVIYDANGGTLTNTADQSVIGETYTARCESGAEPLLRLGYETLHASEGREKVYLSRMTVSDETAGVSFTAVREGYILAGWQVEGADVTYPENAGNQIDISSVSELWSSGNSGTTERPAGTLKAIWEPAATVAFYSDGALYESYVFPQNWYLKICDSGTGVGTVYYYAPSKDGYGFVGWKDRATGQIYHIGDLLATDHDMELDAVWGENITITYKPGEYVFASDNRGLYGTLEADGTITKAGTVGKADSLAPGWYWLHDENNEFFATFWTIEGDDSGTVYANTDTYAPEGDVTFVAVWKAKAALTYQFGEETTAPRGLDMIEAGYYTETRAVDTESPVNYDYGIGVGTAFPFYLKIDEAPGVDLSRKLLGWRVVGGNDGRIYADLEPYYPSGDTTFYIVWDYGWNTDSQGTWYLNEDGTYPMNGLTEIEGKVYLLNEAGYILTGWQKVDGKWHWFDADGVQAIGWKKISGKWYYFDASGVMLNKWQKIGGKWYYFNAGGDMVSGWKQLSGTYYYFNASGVMQTGWQKIGGTYYYFNASGAMATGWQKIGGTYYYFKTSGAMVTGWQKISGTYYYFKTSGAMVTSWQKINNKWYYFSTSGAMKTGWQKISSKWYYFNASGDMVTGWKQIGGKWYWFNSSGVMFANGTTTIGGKSYTFNASGVWVK